MQRAILEILTRLGFLVVSPKGGFVDAALIVEAAHAGGTPVRGVVWRQNVGAAVSSHGGKRRFMRFGIPGLPDIAGILAGGRAISIEVKRPGSKRTDRQEAFNRVATSLGSISVCVSSVESLISELRAAGAIPPSLP